MGSCGGTHVNVNFNTPSKCPSVSCIRVLHFTKFVFYNRCSYIYYRLAAKHTFNGIVVIDSVQKTKTIQKTVTFVNCTAVVVASVHETNGELSAYSRRCASDFKVTYPRKTVHGFIAVV